MKTEIEKDFKWGFLLDEQELRRILKTCKDHVAKLNLPNETVEHYIGVKLRDGSLIETKEIEDVFSLENEGSKSIEKLRIIFKEQKDDAPSWEISVTFQDGKRNSESWTSVYYKIVGESRDWVFLAAAEIEERLKKNKIISWPHISSREWLIASFMMATIVAMLFSMFFLSDLSPNYGSTLEKAYKNKEISNAIEAMIFVEKSKSEISIGTMITPVLIGASIPFCLYLIVLLILPRISLTYNFYWGEFKVVYDKRKNWLTIFWIAIVLGILASIIAGLILRYV